VLHWQASGPPPVPQPQSLLEKTRGDPEVKAAGPWTKREGMYEIRSHVRGTDVPLVLAFGERVLECFVNGVSDGRYHVTGLGRIELAVDERADVDLTVNFVNGAPRVFQLPAEARPEAQLLVASIERDRAATP
jgi:hypothetical protein